MGTGDERRYPIFAILGLRPVKVIKTADGGLDALAFDWKTGNLVSDMNCLADAVFPTDRGDIEWPTEAEFDQYVAELRSKIKSEVAQQGE